MLDACAELVDEVGYEGLTTTLLAERAEVAIGSVYQFFPDKRAIVQALALRNMEAYLDRLSTRFAAGNLGQTRPSPTEVPLVEADHLGARRRAHAARLFERTGPRVRAM